LAPCGRVTPPFPGRRLHRANPLDLNDLLVTNPPATFFIRRRQFDVRCRDLLVIGREDKRSRVLYRESAKDAWLSKYSYGLNVGGSNPG
jgi:hypothetical protein